MHKIKNNRDFTIFLTFKGKCCGLPAFPEYATGHDRLTVITSNAIIPATYSVYSVHSLWNYKSKLRITHKVIELATAAVRPFKLTNPKEDKLATYFGLLKLK